MRCVVQKVTQARVTVEGEITGEIANGYMVLVGAEEGDVEADVTYCAEKISGLRVFEDENGKMNLYPLDAGASELLIVSQFTLWADCKSRRPGFTRAARPETAIPLYEKVVELCRERGFHVETGRFGEDMQVESVNDGPVTIILDTREL